MGSNKLTMGDNQRLEFLGDSVMKLIISHYLFQKFPYHHEGCLSTMRAELVSNSYQARLFETTGLRILAKTVHLMASRVLGIPSLKSFSDDVDEKMRADMFESFLAVLVLDRGLSTARDFLVNAIENKSGVMSAMSKRIDIIGKATYEYAIRTFGWPCKKPVAEWHPIKRALHPLFDNYRLREYGLMRDDAVYPFDEIEKALDRMRWDEPDMFYEREHRMSRAIDLHLKGILLDKDKQLTEDDDIPYLSTFIDSVRKEKADHEKWDHMLDQ
ncbi:hypothetical protein ACOME3_007078 [Neoechinorhynchus agilis]